MNPIILAAVPLAIAPMAFLLQRRATVAVGLSAVASLAWAALCLIMPLSPVLEILGRRMALSRLDHLALTFLGLEAALLTLAEWIGERKAASAPALLLMLGTTTVALMVSHMGMAAILLALAAVIAAFVMAGSDQELALSASSYLALMVMAALLLLAAAWLGDLMPVQANSTTARPTLILVALGLGVLLAVPPFHGWWIVTVRQAPVLAAFLGTMLPAAGLILLVEFIQANPWATAGGSLARILTSGGLLAVVAGGILAAGAEDLSRWMAYATVVGIGCALAGLGTMTVAGAAGAAVLLLNHGLSLALIVACCPRQATGTCRKLMAIGWAVAGLSLSGIPLTAGFTGRWLIYRPLFRQSPILGAILILSSFCLFLGYLRRWRLLALQVDLVQSWGRLILWGLLIGSLSAALLLLGVMPGLLLSSVVEALRGLSFLSP